MYDTLEKLFHGEIDPFGAGRSHNPELLEAQRLFNKLMDGAGSKLGNDLRERIEAAAHELVYAQSRVLFCEGFRLGMRITAESFIDGGA